MIFVLRNNLKGSWFVQCLCRIFMMFSCTEDLETLLLRVTQELKAYCTTKGEKQINETLLRGVTKKLYFNPGLCWDPVDNTASNVIKEDVTGEMTVEESVREVVTRLNISQ